MRKAKSIFWRKNEHFWSVSSRQLKDNGEVRQYYLRIVGKEAWRDNSFSYVQQHSDRIGGITYT